MNLQIRPATAHDEKIVYDFLCELEEETLPPGAFRDTFRRNLHDPAVHYLLANLRGEPVGFLGCHVQHLLHHAGRVAEIQEFFVRPPARGQGVGKQLLAALESRLRREHIRQLEVTTHQRRTAAVGFYQRAAFALSHHKLIKSLPPTDDSPGTRSHP